MPKGATLERIAGPAGALEAIVIEAQVPLRGVAVVCHPNPTQGGSNTNKVVQTIAKALSRQGYVCYCPNLRGVGASEGEHDYGRGEVDDVRAVAAHAADRHGALPLLLAGFSFGGFVAARARESLGCERVLLVGVAVGKYELPTPAVPEDSVVIHGEDDEVIPLAAVMDWARPQNLPVLVFPATGHFFHGKLLRLGLVIARAFK
ncbi:alpha/beta fold hydrolase [Paludibacterium yongneupense]|uniref:alpha/beta hydrolase n=1 Tax=Paludibacterium yongneupense TaxID=400061 RepID=UPI00049069FD